MKARDAAHLAAIAGRNVLLGGNVASLSLLGNPRQLVYYASETLFLYKKLNEKTGLTQRNVSEVFDANGVEDIALGHLNQGGNWFWHASFTADIINLCLLCRILKPKVVFEIGTYVGYTALHFALNTADDARIYTLDLPRDHDPSPALPITTMDVGLVKVHEDIGNYAFNQSDVAPKITCLYGDSAAFDFSPYTGAVDLFFIDGAHSYEYVRSDTLNALQCCHPGSVIAWHDFGRVGVNGVSRWLKEFARGRQVYAIRGGSLAFMPVT